MKGTTLLMIFLMLSIMSYGDNTKEITPQEEIEVGKTKKTKEEVNLKSAKIDNPEMNEQLLSIVYDSDLDKIKELVD